MLTFKQNVAIQAASMTYLVASHRVDIRKQPHRAGQTQKWYNRRRLEIFPAVTVVALQERSQN